MRQGYPLQVNMGHFGDFDQVSVFDEFAVGIHGISVVGCNEVKVLCYCTYCK